MSAPVNSLDLPPTGTTPRWVPGLAHHAWQELALTRTAELRFVFRAIVQHPAPPAAGEPPFVPPPDEVVDAFMTHLVAAEQAATAGRWLHVPLHYAKPTALERAYTHLHAAEVSLLRMAPGDYVVGQLPSLLAQVRSHLPPTDARLQSMEDVATRYQPPRGGAPASDPPATTAIRPEERDMVIAAMRASGLEAQREVARVRSFTRLLYGIAFALTVGVIGLMLVGVFAKQAVPVCFTPDERSVVCPVKARSADLMAPAIAGRTGTDPNQTTLTDEIRRTTSGGDIALVELLGLLAAAVAGAAAMRRLRGTSVPFNLPMAAAVLKLPTGALTAVLGLLLMRGDFVPGLSALDNSAQILAWAVIFGYAQELFTRFADRQAQDVLGKVGSPGDQKNADGTTGPSTPTAPAAGTV